MILYHKTCLPPALCFLNSSFESLRKDWNVLNMADEFSRQGLGKGTISF